MGTNYPHHAFLIDAMNDTLLRIKAEEDADNEEFPEYEVDIHS